VTRTLVCPNHVIRPLLVSQAVSFSDDFLYYYGFGSADKLEIVLTLNSKTYPLAVLLIIVLPHSQLGTGIEGIGQCGCNRNDYGSNSRNPCNQSEYEARTS
jgi:hypothetical protein